MTPTAIIPDRPKADTTVNRHVRVAQKHLEQRRDILQLQITKLQKEVDGVNAAIKALDGE